MRTFRAAASIAVITVMLLTCLTVDVTDDSDAVTSSDNFNGMYGATISLSTAEMEKALETYTGHPFEYYVGMLNTYLAAYDYDIKKMIPYLETETSFRRDVSHDTTVVDHTMRYQSTDHISGLLKIGLDSDITGRFPAAGTYPAKEGEKAPALLARVFTAADRPAESTEVKTNVNLHIYYDVTLVTNMNYMTGEILDSYLTVKLTVRDIEDNNIFLKINEDEYGNLKSLTVAYEEKQTDSMFYLDAEAKLTADGFIVKSGDTAWDINPLIVADIEQSRVSSDLADSLWALALQSAGADMNIGQLPEIILKILNSGSRILDIFETIQSLASTEIPPVGFQARFSASDYTGAHDYKYCKLQSYKDPSNSFLIPWGAYVVDLTKLVKLIPDSVMDQDLKNLIDLVLIGLKWNEINVKDISNDPTTQGKCESISQHVNGMIDSYDTTSYHTPLMYTVLSITGIALTVVALAAMIIIRRRSA